MKRILAVAYGVAGYLVFLAAFLHAVAAIPEDLVGPADVIITERDEHPDGSSPAIDEARLPHVGFT